MVDKKAIYFETLPCEVLSVHNTYDKTGTWTVIKLKPRNKNNFYISESNMDEDIINKFVNAYKNNVKMKFEYQILYEPSTEQEEEENE